MTSPVYVIALTMGQVDTLIGRELEVKYLAELVDGIRDRGGAVVVRGEAGIGKSAIVAEVVALSRNTRVLKTVGVESEQHLPYAGLHQLLYPLLADVTTLPDALSTALGLADSHAPNVYQVGLAALNLLAEAAASTPLLLIAEDVHSLDQPSADVLAFVARRLESEPILLIATVRDGEWSRLDDAGLPSMHIERLSDDDAAALLDAAAPGLTSARRAQLLALAAGNPLALTELPHSPQPLTARLEEAFTARIAGLPAETRAALLVAAVNDSDSVTEALAALGEDISVLTPAVEARLIEVGPGTLTFRHPLMRSAIAQAASPDQQQAAHRALADVVPEDRRAWHRAVATSGPDEDTAADLETVAAHAHRRGGVAAAVNALELAAHLSEVPGKRAERLLRAAELAVESGRKDVVERLIREVDSWSAQQRARATSILSDFEDGLRSPAGPRELADLASSVADAGLAARVLWSGAMRCFWVEPGPDARAHLMSVADRLLPDDFDPRKVAISAYVAPFTRPVDAGLRQLVGHEDPLVQRFLGSAALQFGAFDLSARFSAAAASGLREQGRLGLLTRALAVHAWSSVRLGGLTSALPAAVEAGRLARETGQPFMRGLSLAVQAEIAALRGDYPQADSLATEASRIGLAVGARPVLATVQIARGIAALGQGRHADAFADLRRLHDPTDPAYQLALRCYTMAEFSEAAVRSGNETILRETLREMEKTSRSAASPALHIGLRYANAVLAQDEPTYRIALEADLSGWPLERGRVQLAFGEWLRRQRRAAESRAHLRAARETFDALGAIPLADRARNELRAAGETSPRRTPDARDRLTPHELSIAQLAAEGLTNKEIGQRLYLSHRTVSTHLHRIFPKLGISSRAELAAAIK